MSFVNYQNEIYFRGMTGERPPFTTDLAGLEDAARAAMTPEAFGYVLGLALIMIVTGTAATDPRVYPKFLGAAAMLAIGLTAPVAPAVAGCAAVMTAMAVSMVLLTPTQVDESEPVVLSEV